MIRTALLASGLLVALVPAGSPQDSNRRIRPEPSALAARAGHQVEWRKDLDTALKDAGELQRPVFWYVPTLPGSPMDRKPVLDRMMMAGPFSWPRTITLLNGFFVPLRLVPTKAQCEEFGLAPMTFIEPGYVVLDAKRKVLTTQESVSTFHPDWFLRPLERIANAPSQHTGSFPGHLDEETAAVLFGGSTQEPPPLLQAEALFLFAAGRYFAGEEERARKLWQEMAERWPDHPLTAKAAMELEGHGPLTYGFETYETLPEGAYAGGARGSRAPKGVYSIADLWERSLDFLVRIQRADGGFTDSRYDFGGTDSLPNVYAAVTAIAARAFLEAGPRVRRAPLREAALKKALDYCLDDQHLNRDDQDELVWAFLYRTDLLCRWLELRPDDAQGMRTALSQATAELVGMQSERGAWFHEYANPFVTAQVLLALARARDLDVRPPGLEDAVERGIVALLACRNEQGAITYGMSRRGRNRASVEGGVGRMPLADHALLAWGKGSAKDLQRSLEASFQHQEHLFLVRKYDDHASPHGYGGFFFWYDMQVRTEALGALTDARKRTAWLKQQRDLILSLPEFDGCFVDSHELGRAYGTAMGLVGLALTDVTAPPRHNPPAPADEDKDKEPKPASAWEEDLAVHVPRLVELMEEGLHRQDPNTSILRRAAKDAGVAPLFDGSYDWHSNLIAHWALLRYARHTGDEALAARVLEPITAEALAQERELLTKASERRLGTFPYDQGWALNLLRELERHWDEVPAEVTGFRQELESRILTWLESNPFPENDDPKKMGGRKFIGFYRSWLFSWLQLRWVATSEDSLARLAILKETRILPQVEAIAAHQDPLAFDFLWLPSVLAMIHQVDPLPEAPLFDAGEYQDLPEEVRLNTVHVLGVEVSRLWGLALEARDGDVIARERLNERLREILERHDLWEEDFTVVTHWVPQYLWILWSLSETVPPWE